MLLHHRCLDRQVLNQVALCLTLLSVIPLNAPNQPSCLQLLHIYHLRGNLSSASPSYLTTSSQFQKPEFFPENLFNKLCSLPVSEADLENVLQSMSDRQELWENLLQYDMRYGAPDFSQCSTSTSCIAKTFSSLRPDQFKYLFYGIPGLNFAI